MYETNGNGGGMNYSMPVAPAMYGGYGNGGGLLGGFGGNGDAILLLLLFAIFGGNGWGNGNGGFGGNGLYPWLNNSNQINDGFRDQMINGNITGIQTSVSNGFANAEVAACNRAMDQMQTAYQGQIATLERSFAEQTANAHGFNALQGQLAQCCCDNRLATCQTQNLVSREAADTRAAVSAGDQRIMDKLCQLELDGVKAQLADEQRETANLRNQLNIAAMRAETVQQTAAITAGQQATLAAGINELRSCPIPAMPVYGSQPIYTCNRNNGYGLAS